MLNQLRLLNVWGIDNMPRYRLDFSYKAKIHYDIYIHEDCSLTREDYLMEKIKSIIDETKWELECGYSDREWIGIVIGSILDSWRIEEYEITNESDGDEVNITGMIQFTTPRKTLHDNDISDRLIKTMEIHFDYDGYDLDESVIYEACHYLHTDFWLETTVDSSTIEAKATLKELG